MLTEQIAQCCRDLRLSRNFADMSEVIQADNNQQYLLNLLQKETIYREKLRTAKLIKNAGFYARKDFDKFCFDEVTLPSDVSPQKLKTCDFIETNTNIVMYGNVGTGKTFLSEAIGIEACKKGHPVKFFRTAALVNRLSEAKKVGTLSTFLKTLSKADVLIFDEFGYVPLDRSGAQLLFEVISECYEQKPIILNTNIEFSRWVNVFFDEQMTGAILDRILHHVHLLLFPGPSNRMRESRIE